MATTKHLRGFVKKLNDEFPGITIELLRHRTHFIYQLTFRGVQRRISVSKSPGCAEHAIDNALKDARRYLLESEAHA